jgi:phage tail sheath protein FI
MAFYLSPLVDVNEIDLTTTIPAVSTSTAALVLRKTWKGPELKKQLITNLEDLLGVFGEPNSNNYKDMLSAMGYLKYGNKLWCTRAMPLSSRFAGTYGSLGTSATNTVNLTPYTTGNAFVMSDLASDDPDQFHDDSPFAALPTSGSDISIIANSRGIWGNYTKVAIVDRTTYATVTSASGGTFAQYQTAGGTLGETLWGDVQNTDYPIESQREFIVIVKTAEQDNINKVSIPYVIKEVFYVSTNETKVDDEGNNIFAPNVINNTSKYIRIALASGSVNADFYCVTNAYEQFAGGVDGFATWTATPTLEDTEVLAGYNLYQNPEVIDINILIDSDKRLAVKQRLVAIAELRKDCIAICDCYSTSVVNQSASEVTNLRDFRLGTYNENSSYVALYGNWLEMFDQWSSKYRWIPASGHIAGIMARTDDVSDPWFAPAGLNRAVLTNIRRLAWSPTLGERDILYKNGINPIVSFAGQGKVVWGQKTMLDKPSAFNRINIRRLFIVMEKAISTAAKYFLFEPNDEFTRLSIVNMIEPFLRDVRGRRGIYDFMVVCDERNNTGERIDRQELWVDIYVKPTKAAEFIVLNFIATKTSASFTELVGMTGEGL